MVRTIRLIITIISITCVLGALVSCKSVEQTVSLKQNSPEDIKVEHFRFHSGPQLEQLFNDLNYTPKDCLSGTREVPRLFLAKIPKLWHGKDPRELDVVTKKKVFFLSIAPLVLRSNELIQKKRDRIAAIIEDLRASAPVSAEDRDFLRETAVAYKVVGEEGDLNDPAVQDKILRRVDTLPPSLVLAQAAEESAWGTSRFAVEGNALFGMWTWSGKGITPLKKRSGLGDYKIASYKTPLQSVMAYMHNLNTHQAYKKLRAKRAELRNAGAKVTGWALAKTLSRYSERGQAYVNSLHSLMRVNKLQAADDAYLADGPTTLLIPADEKVQRLASLWKRSAML